MFASAFTSVQYKSTIDFFTFHHTTCFIRFSLPKTQHLWCHGDPYFNFIHALGTIGLVGGMHKTLGSKSTVFISRSMRYILCYIL